MNFAIQFLTSYCGSECLDKQLQHCIENWNVYVLVSFFWNLINIRTVSAIFSAVIHLRNAAVGLVVSSVKSFNMRFSRSVYKVVFRFAMFWGCRLRRLAIAKLGISRSNAKVLTAVNEISRQERIYGIWPVEQHWFCVYIQCSGHRMSYANAAAKIAG